MTAWQDRTDRNPPDDKLTPHWPAELEIKHLSQNIGVPNDGRRLETPKTSKTPNS